MLTPAASLSRERPHREQAEKNHQGDPGTVTVERVHSLASLGRGTEGRFRKGLQALRAPEWCERNDVRFLRVALTSHEATPSSIPGLPSLSRLQASRPSQDRPLPGARRPLCARPRRFPAEPEASPGRVRRAGRHARAVGLDGDAHSIPRSGIQDRVAALNVHIGIA